MYFVRFYYNGFSTKLVKIAQKVDLATWLASGATCEGHIRSTCQKLKSQCVSRLISWLGQLTRRPAKCTDSWDLKCAPYILHSYYTYPHYPQDWKRGYSEDNPREVSTTNPPCLRELLILNREIFAVSSLFPLPLLYLERKFVPKYNSHLFRL